MTPWSCAMTYILYICVCINIYICYGSMHVSASDELTLTFIWGVVLLEAFTDVRVAVINITVSFSTVFSADLWVSDRDGHHRVSFPHCDGSSVVFAITRQSRISLWRHKNKRDLSFSWWTVHPFTHFCVLSALCVCIYTCITQKSLTVALLF